MPFATGGTGRAFGFRKTTWTELTPLLSMMNPLVAVAGPSPLTAEPGWSVMKQARKSTIWYFLLPPLAGCTFSTGT